MRIDLNSFNSVGSSQEVSTAQRAATRPTSPEDGDGVTAQLSSDATFVNNVGSGDDIRQDRVSALRQAIQSGTYRINAGGIAAAMMDSMFKMRVTI